MYLLLLDLLLAFYIRVTREAKPGSISSVLVYIEFKLEMGVTNEISIAL